MRTLYAGFFVSADGVAESPNLFVFPSFDEAVGAEVSAGMARTDTVLLGRQLYEEWAAYWPGKTAADDGYAEFINPVRKVVLSTTLDSVSWENSELVREDHLEAVRRLKAEEGGDIAINGSMRVAQSMLRAGLLDELRLLVFPVIVGEGRRLLDSVDRTGLRLVESKALPTGVLSLTYAVERGGDGR
jgi:dihydrofolate reductase